MTAPDPTAYDNAPFIPDGPAYFDRWREQADDYRSVEQAVGRARLNLTYGDHPREAFDLFLPATGRPTALLVFLHGGFWRTGDHRLWSHLAAGAQGRGWAAALPSYPLAPEARIADITRAIARALPKMAATVPGPLLLAGHSAGGHLALRMACPDAGLPAATSGRLAAILAISPLADLRPLVGLPMNADLRLDGAEAAAESPLRHPAPSLPVRLLVGAAERPAFLDQARWMADAWSAPLRIAGNRHHFDVIDTLADPESPDLADLAALL
jgi:acetyl esterase/lipase